jgi:uncharacterized protein (DUF58 family)
MTPTRLLLFFWGLLAVIGLLIPLFPILATVWIIVLGLLSGLVLFDYFLIRPRPDFTLSRTVHHSLPITAWSRISLTICSSRQRPCRLTVCDFVPARIKQEGMPVAFTLLPERCATLEYRVYPLQRGLFTFSGVDVVVTSPLACWRKKWFFPLEDAVRVFPNFRELGNYTLMAISHQLNQMGIKQLQQRGQGGEFHQLRQYHEGDEISRIDWKATSRYQRLISREFQNERDQQLIFLLDCGRRMRHEENGSTFLDQALAAMLLLAHVAIRQGDAAGVYTFGGREKWIPPLKRGDAMRQLLLHTFDLEATGEAADYLQAAGRIMALQGRRSLIVLLTNSRAEDQDDVLQSALLLARRHLVIVADLREPALDRALQEPVNSLETALRYQALSDYLNQRTALRRNFAWHGIQSVDVTADKLPAALVNRYLDIKSQGRL